MLQPAPAGLTAAGAEPSPDLQIRPAATAVTAFVGRTLKGPIDEPVPIGSFAQYVQVFGGIWQPSPLSYAVEQYFENGGQQAIIVRVASAGQPPTLDLPAGDQLLVLSGLHPGSREYLRASVDYDGIQAGDDTLFNLVIQRVRAPGSELVEQQEIFRRLSLSPASTRHAEAVLAGSKLVRIGGPLPSQRPDLTLGAGAHALVGYVACNADGDDGAVLSDYDLIGSETLRRGLFALERGPAFNFLCLPPLARDRDVGLSALVVAARYCRQRHALLLVDPPQSWRDAGQALEDLPNWAFHSPDALMFFPRIAASDRLRGRTDVFASGGAAAGLMARADAAGPHWWVTDPAELPLRSTLLPAHEVTATQRRRFAQHGVNVFRYEALRGDTELSARTLGGGLSAGGEVRSLTARRLLLWIKASLEQGTRWVSQCHNEPSIRAQACAQVLAFLEGVASAGAFRSAGLGDERFVLCDERLNGPLDSASGEFHLLYGISTQQTGRFETWLMTHRAGGSLVRSVSVNRLATSGQQVQLEIETAILRGLTR